MTAQPIPLKTRRAVHNRSEGHCELCGFYGATHIHHRKLRSQGGDHSLENLLHVHVVCHNYAHLNTARYDMGWLVRRADDPATVPVVLMELPGSAA